MIQLPRELFERFIDAVCYAASMDKVELRNRKLINQRFVPLGLITSFQSVPWT